MEQNCLNDLNVQGNLDVTGNATVGGTLTVPTIVNSGTITLDGTNLDVLSNCYLDGALNVTGGLSLGTDLDVINGGTGASTAAGARINLGAAASSVTITAGTGLTGGGDLTANRTISLGSHTHAVTEITGGTSVRAYRSTNQTLTQSAYTTLVFDSEGTDTLGEYNPATGVFTPANSGLYLITAAVTNTGVMARMILMMRAGSTNVRRIFDADATEAGGTILADLTASTSYTFDCFPLGASPVASGAESDTFLRIRRVY